MDNLLYFKMGSQFLKLLVKEFLTKADNKWFTPIKILNYIKVDPKLFIKTVNQIFFKMISKFDNLCNNKDTNREPKFTLPLNLKSFTLDKNNLFTNNHKLFIKIILPQLI